ncbi:MAG: hypothetical protein ACLTMP_02205 [Eggerthella lenta]
MQAIAPPARPASSRDSTAPAAARRNSLVARGVRPITLGGHGQFHSADEHIAVADPGTARLVILHSRRRRVWRRRAPCPACGSAPARAASNDGTDGRSSLGSFRPRSAPY